MLRTGSHNFFGLSIEFLLLKRPAKDSSNLPIFREEIIKGNVNRLFLNIKNVPYLNETYDINVDDNFN